MPVPRSAALAVWARAWLAGQVAFDDVIATLTADGRSHTVVGLPAILAAHQGGGPDHRSLGGGRTVPDELPNRLGAALIAWRAAGAEPQVILPVPGDVRGVPGPRPFLDAALDHGEGVYGGGLGLVPSDLGPDAEVGPPQVVWSAFAVTAAAPDPVALPDAEHELAAAMRETATLFTTAGIGGGAASPAVQQDLVRARRASEAIRIPAGFPPRAAALLSQAERLHAALAVAGRDPYGGATDRVGIAVRAEALRRLHTTVRRARLAAYNSGPTGR